MADQTAPSEIELDCLRYDPQVDRAPRLQRYRIGFTPDMSLLQGLQQIKDEIDGSLTFRWSCRMAICGSCGMMVNGTPQLACHIFLRDLAPGPVRVEPLENFPILRDLVIDQTSFLDKLESVRPYLIPKDNRTLAEGPRRQTPQELARYYATSQCINCLLCYAACPQTGLNPDFIGPAALALAHRYNADSRDTGFLARADVLNSEEGVWGCTLVGECSEVCPKGVDPAHAVNRTKLRGLIDFLGLGRAQEAPE